LEIVVPERGNGSE